MKVLLIAAVSADGKIAESDHQLSLDWTSKEDLKFFVDRTKEAGVVIMGQTTFDTFGKPLKGRRLIVLSKKGVGGLEGVGGVGGVETVKMDVRDLVDQLASEGNKEVVVAGGASVYGQFLNEGLVTDVYLTVEPYLFGGGVPLATGFDRVQMKLEDVSRLGAQGVLLHYTI
jgi:dihydrofolate reductase